MILSHRLRAAAGNSGEQLPDIITTNLEQHIDFGFLSCYNQSSSYSAVSDLSGNGNNMVVYWDGSPLTSSNASELTVDTGTTPSHVNLGGSGNTDEKLDLRQTNNVWGNLGTSDYTWEFWLNIKQVNQSYQWIYYDSAVSHAEGNSIRINQGRMTLYGVFNNASDTYLDPSSQSIVYQFQTNNNTLKGWEHLVFSKIGTGSNNFKFYRNSSLVNTLTDGDRNQNANNFTSNGNTRLWGLINYAGFQLQGKFAIHRFYRGKGLTQSEVTYNYNAQKARFGL